MNIAAVNSGFSGVFFSSKSKRKSKNELYEMGLPFAQLPDGYFPGAGSTRLVEYSYNNFVKKLAMVGITNENIQDIESFLTPKNQLGRGRFGVVYKFPQASLKEWVIKVENDAYGTSGLTPEDTLEKVDDDLPLMNMGNPIAQIGGGKIKILKKAAGESHSFKDWIQYLKLDCSIGPEDSMEFLNNLEKIAEFPQSSFNQLARRINYLDKRDYKADTLNPNNIMVNMKDKRFSIVDSSKKEELLDYAREHDNFFMNHSKESERTEALHPTVYDLIYPLLDYANFGRCLKDLDDEQKARLFGAAKNVINKCIEAGMLYEFEQSHEPFLNYANLRVTTMSRAKVFEQLISDFNNLLANFSG